ncbi:hypothetical protein N8368_01680 [Bacteroidia bacterium]|nr:hypothetical protein [Bacteroidia bacterium]MDC1395199.1 hypothetical protein [Bacteroidia bacterium]
MKNLLGTIGSYAAIFGVLSTIMNFFDYNMRLLMWIDLWGETTGWIIRIALIVVGAALWFMFGRGGNEEAAKATE